ncbi:MAG: glycine--tRNA ligase [Candidatus Nezhaarchaeota archaeon]|nr:glycine--tRNA ligase [Candidatus Nezhaarchaeota archaeon]MCX8141529.1 glycine--tRNA ligase [Candidatus Nezhaarchaeota archaeon]MDW8049796.1 glycine--tRNA ligase [Nitrososphaerota archaeon]
MSVADKVMELARRRGFFWISAELYGGVSGFLDLGPLGKLLKRKIEEKWRYWFVLRNQDFVVEIETPIITPYKVFEASGHVHHFTDYIAECLKCGRKFRADHLIEEQTGLSGLEGMSEEQLSSIMIEKGVKCPECGGQLSNVKRFNLLFRTTIGPYSENIGFARPEAAQGMFTTFNKVYGVMRNKLPLGIAQIGKVMRNEISPRQGPIRLREFTIMELELFYDPQEPSCPVLDKGEVLRLVPESFVAERRFEALEITVREALDKKLVLSEWLAYFMVSAQKFVKDLGIPWDKQMFIAKLPQERAHYAAQVYDQVVKLDKWGWVEVSGHAFRTDYDLRGHMAVSGEDLRVYKRMSNEEDVEEVEVKPVIEAIEEDYGVEASQVIHAIRMMPGERVQEEISSKSYFEMGKYRIYAKHVKFERVRRKVKGRKFIPFVAEPSFGAERLLYAAIEHAYREKEGRIVLSLPPDVAPIEAVVLPLVSRDGLPEKAREVYNLLKMRGIIVEYDEAGYIGRRYARADEVGIPLAITIDNQTLKDGTVTIRDRDTWRQVRCPIQQLPDTIEAYVRRKELVGPIKDLFSLSR